MRGMSHALTVSVLAVLIAVGISMPTQARDKFSLVHSFCTKGTHNACGDGSNPSGGLVMDAAGNFYGTTYGGGQEFGTVFEIEAEGGGNFKFKTIYRFCHLGQCGINPNGALIIDTFGNLYGTANDVVFELSPQSDGKPWSEKVLYNFCSQQNCTDGRYPIAGLTYAGASSGHLYDGVSPLFGTTVNGGANNGGTVFELTYNGLWDESVLYSFCSKGGDDCTDGMTPQGGVVMDASGNLFGTTVQGGLPAPHLNGAGVVFELAASGGNAWSENTLYSFCTKSHCSDGARPLAGLAIDADGVLYGTTSYGGRRCSTQPSGCGAVFSIVPNGTQSQETVLYAFCKKKDCEDGSSPVGGLFLDSSRNIFGTTFQGGGNDIDEFGLGGGTVFELSGTFHKVLYRFCSQADCADGEYPDANVTLNGSGQIVGVTELGGISEEPGGNGTVFELTPK